MAAACSGAAPSAADAVVAIDGTTPGAPSAAATVGGASKPAAIPFDVTEDILGHIRALKEQQLELKNARKVVTKQLRNQSKRMARIRKRARLLSDRDLLALLKIRKDNQKAEDVAE